MTPEEFQGKVAEDLRRMVQRAERAEMMKEAKDERTNKVDNMYPVDAYGHALWEVGKRLMQHRWTESGKCAWCQAECEEEGDCEDNCGWIPAIEMALSVVESVSGMVWGGRREVHDEKG